MPEGQLQDPLFRLMHGIKTIMYRKVKASSMSLAPMQLRALKVISVIDGCTAQDIADFLERDKAQVTRLLNELMDQQLIDKKLNPDDRRSQLLVINKRGMAMISELAEIETQVFTTLFSDISNDEREIFFRVVKHMTDNLKSLRV